MKILSLFWHSVDPDSLNPLYRDGMNPTVSVFREQVKYILGNYTPISIYEFRDIMQHTKSTYSYSKPPVLLGFDDGFKNILLYALPILKEFDIPALLFVICDLIDRDNYVPWDVEMKYLIRRTKKGTVLFRNRSFTLGIREDETLLRRLFAQTYKTCKSEKSRHALLNDLASQLGMDRVAKISHLDDDLQLISETDLSLLNSSSLLTVASHGMTHRYLSSLTYEEQEHELEESNSILSRYCTHYFPTFAYPLGNFNNDTVSIAKKIYHSAFAIHTNSSYSNLFAYPRTCIGDSTSQHLRYALNPLRLNFILPLKGLLNRISTRNKI